ncbi:unnamed protein product, partial [Nesidiocoris tenuis]
MKNFYTNCTLLIRITSRTSVCGQLQPVATPISPKKSSFILHRAMWNQPDDEIDALATDLEESLRISSDAPHPSPAESAHELMLRRRPSFRRERPEEVYLRELRSQGCLVQEAVYRLLRRASYGDVSAPDHPYS